MRDLAAFVLGGMLAASAASASPAAPVVIAHTAIVDVATGTVLADRTVVVEHGRIVEVAPAATARLPKGATVIDGSGKYLIPGLWDMHIHAFFGDWVPGGREVTLPLLLAMGITGARDMGSDLDPILEARRDVAQGRLLGPRLIVSGPMLDGPKSQFPAALKIGTPEDGRRAVEMLQGRGVDFIKIQSYVPREAYFAIAAECRKRGIPFAGHVPDAIRAAEASDAGQASFEHLIGVFEGSSTAEEAFLEGPKGPGRFLDTYVPGKEVALNALLAKNGTWQCPTLYWERGQWLVDAIDVTKDPDGKYAPLSWREKTWPKFAGGIMKDLDTDPLPVRERFVTHELEIVSRQDQAGIRFLAGTDTPAGVDVIPGPSLHRELERFVAAGFTPLQALQTATLNPAKFLGKTADFGSVEKGKIADLLLLDANPLEDIRYTRRVAAVVANGRAFTRADLDRILLDIEAYAKTH
jgi:imidazolonepropionase-like amidohydrolase